jgi:hypothetical protein
MEIPEIRRRYFLYVILNNFTQSLFFAFGALLIFSKTHSILGVLIFNLAGDLAAVLTKSLGFGTVTRAVRDFKFVPVMIMALLMNVFSYGTIFLLKNNMQYFYFSLIMVAIIGNIGSAIYNVCGNTLMFEVIGNSSVPGFSAAQINILEILSGFLAVLVGIVLSRYGLFNFAFLAGALMLLISVMPLYGIPSPEMPRVSFRENIKTIPRSMLWANFNPDHEIQVSALPLVILLLSASLKLSVNINAVIAGFSIIFTYLAGFFKDRDGAWLVWLSLLVGAASWTAYVFVKTPLGFILPGILISFIMGIMTLYREARMGPFMKAIKSFWGGTFAIEFMRSLGSLAGTIIILSVYLIFKTLPKEFLAMSWIFLIPLAVYGAKRSNLSAGNDKKYTR